MTGKQRDDLQRAMAVIKEADLDVPLQFTNFPRLASRVFLNGQVLIDEFQIVNVEDSIKDNEFQHPEHGEAGEVRANDERGVHQVTPRMCVHFVTGPERT